MSALADYFDHFSFSNATIDDLLFYISKIFPTDVSLDNWKETWLETASLNIL
jgi:aminopeptidase N